jgi:hypothetical protein
MPKAKPFTGKGYRALNLNRCTITDSYCHIIVHLEEENYKAAVMCVGRALYPVSHPKGWLTGVQEQDDYCYLAGVITIFLNSTGP